MGLSKKHQAFVEEYIACYFNATEAYQRVYPKSSHNAARAHATRLVANGDIDAEIKERVSAQAMGPAEVLMRLGEHARNEHGKYISASGIVNLSQLIADGKSHLIKGVKETKYGKEIEFYDAQAALVHIGKHHKLFSDKDMPSGSADDPIHVTYIKEIRPLSLQEGSGNPSVAE